jgi:hypothetical protein
MPLSCYMSWAKPATVQMTERARAKINSFFIV